MSWFNIETAPKDRRIVLSNGINAEAAKWHGNTWCRVVIATKNGFMTSRLGFKPKFWTDLPLIEKKKEKN